MVRDGDDLDRSTNNPKMYFVQEAYIFLGERNGFSNNVIF